MFCHAMSCSPCPRRSLAVPFPHVVPPSRPVLLHSLIAAGPAPERQDPLPRVSRARPRALAPARFARLIAPAPARARRAQGALRPFPRKGAEKPAGRAPRRVPVAVHRMEHNGNNMRFQPLQGDFSGATDSGRRKRRAVPGYRRPISAVSVSNRRRQAGQRRCTVSGSIRWSKSLAWPILRYSPCFVFLVALSRDLSTPDADSRSSVPGSSSAFNPSP